MSLCALSFALCAGMVSCEKTPDNSYEGTNYIYLSSDNTSMYGVQGESITVNVMLTTSLDEDAEINFEVKGGEGIVELEGNPVRIPAGETTASFDIVCSASFRSGQACRQGPVPVYGDGRRIIFVD